MTPRNSALAIASDGSLWSVVRRLRAGRCDVVLTRLEGGEPRPEVAIEVAPHTEASLVADPERPWLHVAWSRFGKGPHAAMYRCWDYEASRWVGPATRIVPDEADHVVGDLAITTDGKVVAVVRCGKTPQLRGGWSSAWSSSICVLEDAKWSSPMPIGDASSYSGYAQVVAVGKTAHLLWIASAPIPAVHHRIFDVTKMKWRTKEPTRIDPSVHLVSPALCLTAAADGDGNLYCTWAHGSGVTPGQGALWLSFADAEKGYAWTSERIAADPPVLPMKGFASLGVTGGPGAHATVVYSKQDEGHRVLYSRTAVRGKLFGPERVLERSRHARAFERVQSLRTAVKANPVRAITSGYGADGGVRLVGAGRQPAGRAAQR